MKVCRADMGLHLFVAFRSASGRREIVRLKPDLLQAFGFELVRNVTNEPNAVQVAGDA